MNAFEPAYLGLHRSGELRERADRLFQNLRSCRLCPRSCGADRLGGERGECGLASGFKVASAGPHFGEEAPLVGRGGSGTIFFSNCNLLCCFCQNRDIAHEGAGRPADHRELADMMLGLQEYGCHNINLVTPTHVVPHILKALELATANGLRLPLVYNTGGYDSLWLIRQLDGIVDIYLPDFKYQDGELAARYGHGARDYPEVAAAVITEMHRQVGQLRQDSHGVAVRGLMIRHLVMPNNIAGTDRFVRWVVEKLGPDTYVNIMAQYHPAHDAFAHPEIARRITGEEFQQALTWARQARLRRLDS